jgi:hypothetical protein
MNQILKKPDGNLTGGKASVFYFSYSKINTIDRIRSDYTAVKKKNTSIKGLNRRYPVLTIKAVPEIPSKG